jgi:hypothetical protein
VTLILTAANSRAVYQSSDYQLCDAKTGAPVSDSAGSKQLQASFKDLHLNLAFTGVAANGSSRTIDWLGDEIKTLQSAQPEVSLQEICDALALRATKELKPLGERGVLTAIVAAAETAKPFRVAVISNVRDWSEQPPRAKNRFDIRIHTITKPFTLISGYRDAVPVLEQHRLKALARVSNRTSVEILDALKSINAAAAPHSNGYVSADCWVTSQLADGPGRRTAGINTAKQGGSIPHLQAGVDLHDVLKKIFRPGTLGNLVQSASVFGSPGTPSPPPDGEPRCFSLSGSSATSVLMSSTGHPCASIRIAQIESQVTIRRNETATVPFATVRISGFRPGPFPDCPRPLWPWPSLILSFTIDGVRVPRGCEYHFGNWIESGEHHLIISPSSRSIRKLPMLQDNEEFTLLAPISECLFTWSNQDSDLTATLEANFSWRMCPEMAIQTTEQGSQST